MGGSFLTISDIFAPRILIAEKNFLIAYKPPKMHSAPLKSPVEEGGGETLLGWCAQEFPEITLLPGRRAGEGGLLHRLDYETQGLLLIARTGPGMEALLAQQKEGTILKEYSALAAESKTILRGFPPEKPEIRKDIQIRSAFRPYGPGRKAVRPVTGEGYITKILGIRPLDSSILSFHLSLFRGFRHQIRSHLAWLDRPILNDSLYGGPFFGKGFLGLRASSLSFTDPSSDRELVYSIPPLDPDEI